MRRFEEKDREVQATTTAGRISDVLQSYEKYFNLDYLFRVGETGMPGGWNMRHSVPGAGELTWILFPLVIAGIIGIFRVKDGTSRVMGIAGLTAIILYPLPDAVTTNPNAPPYTFSTYSMMIGVPLLAGLGIHWLSGLFQGRSFGRFWSDWVLPVGLLAIVLVGAIRFFDGPYRDYPNVSAEYYGWQYGAGAAIDGFRSHPGYDRYVLDGDFNAASVFVNFYLHDDPDLRAITSVSWPDRYDGRGRVLYAVRVERYDRIVQSSDSLRKYMQIVDVINYPNGSPAMYLVELSPNSPWGPREVPF
jgi:hypothetical protein